VEFRLGKEGCSDCLRYIAVKERRFTQSSQREEHRGPGVKRKTGSERVSECQRIPRPTLGKRGWASRMCIGGSLCYVRVWAVRRFLHLGVGGGSRRGLR
jgi:hypothetical protein